MTGFIDVNALIHHGNNFTKTETCYFTLTGGGGGGAHIPFLWERRGGGGYDKIPPFFFFKFCDV